MPELLQGTLDFRVLKTLDGSAALHGWGIAERIQRSSDDLLYRDHGALYPALLRLENRGWIRSEWGLAGNNRLARFYSLTRTGRKQVDEEVAGGPSIALFVVTLTAPLMISADGRLASDQAIIYRALSLSNRFEQKSGFRCQMKRNEVILIRTPTELNRLAVSLATRYRLENPGRVKAYLSTRFAFTIDENPPVFINGTTLRWREMVSYHERGRREAVSHALAAVLVHECQHAHGVVDELPACRTQLEYLEAAIARKVTGLKAERDLVSKQCAEFISHPDRYGRSIKNDQE